MALPTAPTGITGTTITSANPLVGPNLYYGTATSSVGATIFLTADGAQPIEIGAAPDVTSVTWVAVPPTGAGPAMAYGPIQSATPHGVYLTAGILSYD